MRVAGDQRFVVRERHSWKIFKQVVTVAYLKKNQISLEANIVEGSFNKVVCLRACNVFAKTVDSF